MAISWAPPAVCSKLGGQLMDMTDRRPSANDPNKQASAEKGFFMRIRIATLSPFSFRFVMCVAFSAILIPLNMGGCGGAGLSTLVISGCPSGEVEVGDSVTLTVSGGGGGAVLNTISAGSATLSSETDRTTAVTPTSEGSITVRSVDASTNESAQCTFDAVLRATCTADADCAAPTEPCRVSFCADDGKCSERDQECGIGEICDPATNACISPLFSIAPSTLTATLVVGVIACPYGSGSTNIIEDAATRK